MSQRAARAAWTSLLLVPLVGALLAVKGLVSGAPSNPAVVTTLTGLDWQQLSAQQPGVAQLLGVLKRHESLAMLAWSFWLAWSNIHGRRTPARWVWYGWWSVPAITVGIMATGAGAGGVMSWTLPVLTAYTVLALLLSRGLFLGLPS